MGVSSCHGVLTGRSSLLTCLGSDFTQSLIHLGLDAWELLIVLSKSLLGIISVMVYDQTTHFRGNLHGVTRLLVHSSARGYLGGLRDGLGTRSQ